MSDNELLFVTTMDEYLTALRDVYPDCIKVVGYQVAFRTRVKNKSEEQRRSLGRSAMEEYRQVMQPWYSRCSDKDETLINENINR